MAVKIAPFPVKLSPAGREAIRAVVRENSEAGARVTESDVVREALHLYFMARGIEIEFSPGLWGVHYKDSGEGQGDETK